MFATHQLNAEMRVCDGQPSHWLADHFKLNKNTFRMVRFLPGTRLGGPRGGWAVGYVTNGSFLQLCNLDLNPDGSPTLTRETVSEVGRRLGRRDIDHEQKMLDADYRRGMELWEQADENNAKVWKSLSKASRGGLGGNMDSLGDYNGRG